MKTLSRPYVLMFSLGWLLCASLSAEEITKPAVSSSPIQIVTNLLQLHQLLNHEQWIDCSLHLEGVVCMANQEERVLVLRDVSGAELLHLNWLGNDIQPGERIALDGTNCAVVRMAVGLGIEAAPLIDNNGVHGMIEKTGTVDLMPGWQPIRLAWFNGGGPMGLKLEYETPAMPRQPVPDAALFRAMVDPASGQTNYVGGLDYRCIQGGWWNVLPDFDVATTMKSGVVSNFDLSVRSRNEFVALEFSGYLQVLRSGTHTFHLSSDDGSKFSIGATPYRLQTLGAIAIPQPQQVIIGQLLKTGEDSQWAEMEGMISFVDEQPGKLELELKSEGGRVQVQIMNRSGLSPRLFLNSRVRLVGVCQSVTTLDGRRIPGILLVPGWRQVEPLELAPPNWNEYPVRPISTLGQMAKDEFGERIAHVRGRLYRAGREQLVLRDQTGAVNWRTARALPQNEKEGGQVEVLGLLMGTGADQVIQCGFSREEGKPLDAMLGSLPQLTTAAQVKELSPDEARRGYPVVIRGTAIGIISGFPSFVIQDSTSGIFVLCPDLGRPDPPQIGEFWQVEGITSAGDFAPIVSAQQIKRLDQGRLPEPLRPTWDQLINGSADTQYGEIQGVVTDVQSNTVVLLCRGGKIKVNLPEMSEKSLERYENSLVRIRGCLMAIWNVQTHQVKAGEIQMANPTISADAPNTVDLFATTRPKLVSDLLRFDLRASAFQHVKVVGQFMRREGREYYLHDGANGLRFIPKAVPHIELGDEVEVVGLPELGGPSPMLREALVRKTGHALLPPAVRLQAQDLHQAGLEGSLVKIEATLVNLNNEPAEQVLEMQVGFQVFAALLPTGTPPVRNIQLGSRLALTGVYASLGSDQSLGRGSESFELLLNSPGDIQVLSRPAWWTLRRFLIVLGILLGVLVLAAVWITQLQRQVAERTVQLESQIQTRERLEYQGNLERERTRIARDLHDELGSDLTEISMLAQDRPEPVSGHLARVSALIRNLVVKLDEVVWAVDPSMDNTVSLANYLTSFAEEFLGAARVTCRVRLPSPVPEWPIPANIRHQLFLAVKEALNNAVRHGHAKEVTLQMDWKGNVLEITIQDQGKGFDPGDPGSGHGLRNFQNRLTGINGRCLVESQPGKGTTIKFLLPLDQFRMKELPKSASPH